MDYRNNSLMPLFHSVTRAIFPNSIITGIHPSLSITSNMKHTSSTYNLNTIANQFAKSILHFTLQ